MIEHEFTDTRGKRYLLEILLDDAAGPIQLNIHRYLDTKGYTNDSYSMAIYNRKIVWLKYVRKYLDIPDETKAEINSLVERMLKLQLFLG